MKTYIFRVVPDIEDNIFRDIELREDQTFEELHLAIIAAFEFRGDQMASFYMSDDEWSKGEEIGLMDMGFGEEMGPRTMSSTVLNSMIIEPDEKILYLYDFLKMWIFYVELVDEKEVENGAEYPRLLREIGVSPNEDDKEIPDLLEGLTDSAPTKDPMQSEIDDIMNEYGDEDDFGGGFENIDDYDI